MNLQLTHLFEELAAKTWELIGDSYKCNISFGEETITDLNLLEIKRAELPAIRIFKIDKQFEAKCGFDWEFWIGSALIGWRRYVVQAKKLSKDGFYRSLKHKAGKTGVLQVEVLFNFAQLNGAIPLYCFYNYVAIPDFRCWKCCQEKFQPKQFGCTLVALEDVRSFIYSRRSKNFSNAHSSSSALPWRCLVGCPKTDPLLDTSTRVARSLANPFITTNIVVRVYPELPGFLTNPRGDYINLLQRPSELYQSEFDIFPERIAVIDVLAR